MILIFLFSCLKSNLEYFAKGQVCLNEQKFSEVKSLENLEEFIKHTLSNAKDQELKIEDLLLNSLIIDKFAEFSEIPMQNIIKVFQDFGKSFSSKDLVEFILNKLIKQTNLDCFTCYINSLLSFSLIISEEEKNIVSERFKDIFISYLDFDLCYKNVLVESKIVRPIFSLLFEFYNKDLMEFLLRNKFNQRNLLRFFEVSSHYGKEEFLKDFARRFFQILDIKDEKVAFAKIVKSIFNIRELYEILYEKDYNLPEFKSYKYLLRYVTELLDSLKSGSFSVEGIEYIKILGDLTSPDEVGMYSLTDGSMIHEYLAIKAKKIDLFVDFVKRVATSFTKEAYIQNLNKVFNINSLLIYNHSSRSVILRNLTNFDILNLIMEKDTKLGSELLKIRKDLFDRINFIDDFGSSLLIDCVKEGKNTKILKALLDNNADLDIKDNDGKKALIYAAENGDWGSFIMLSKSQADEDDFYINKFSNEVDSTLLISAIRGRNPKIVERVLVVYNEMITEPISIRGEFNHMSLRVERKLSSAKEFALKEAIDIASIENGTPIFLEILLHNGLASCELLEYAIQSYKGECNEKWVLTTELIAAACLSLNDDKARIDFLLKDMELQGIFCNIELALEESAAYLKKIFGVIESCDVRELNKLIAQGHYINRSKNFISKSERDLHTPFSYALELYAHNLENVEVLEKLKLIIKFLIENGGNIEVAGHTKPVRINAIFTLRRLFNLRKYLPKKLEHFKKLEDKAILSLFDNINFKPEELKDLMYADNEDLFVMLFDKTQLRLFISDGLEDELLQLAIKKGWINTIERLLCLKDSFEYFNLILDLIKKDLSSPQFLPFLNILLCTKNVDLGNLFSYIIKELHGIDSSKLFPAFALMITFEEKRDRIIKKEYFIEQLENTYLILEEENLKQDRLKYFKYNNLLDEEEGQKLRDQLKEKIKQKINIFDDLWDRRSELVSRLNEMFEQIKLCSFERVKEILDQGYYVNQTNEILDIGSSVNTPLGFAYHLYKDIKENSDVDQGARSQNIESIMKILIERGGQLEPIKSKKIISKEEIKQIIGVI